MRDLIKILIALAFIAGAFYLLLKKLDNRLVLGIRFLARQSNQPALQSGDSEAGTQFGLSAVNSLRPRQHEHGNLRGHSNSKVRCSAQSAVSLVLKVQYPWCSWCFPLPVLPGHAVTVQGSKTRTIEDFAT